MRYGEQQKSAAQRQGATPQRSAIIDVVGVVRRDASPRVLLRICRREEMRPAHAGSRYSTGECAGMRYRAVMLRANRCTRVSFITAGRVVLRY